MNPDNGAEPRRRADGRRREVEDADASTTARLTGLPIFVSAISFLFGINRVVWQMSYSPLLCFHK